MNTKKPDLNSLSSRAASELDPGFGDGGFVRVPDPYNSGAVLSLGSVVGIDPAGDSDQLIYIAAFGGIGNYIVRLLADGQIDQTFGERGYAELPNLTEPRHYSPYIRSFLFDEGGGVTCFGEVSGPFNKGHYTYTYACRFTVAGILDRTFGAEGVAVYDLPDPNPGRSEDFLRRSAMDKLGPAAFPGQAGVSHGRVCNPARVSMLADGKILFVANVYNDLQRANKASYLVRINRDGGLDADFADSGALLIADPVEGELIHVWNYDAHRHGGITVLGMHGGINKSEAIVARFDAEGRLERGFGEFGIVRIADPGFPSASLQPNSLSVLDDGGVISVLTLFVGTDDSVTAVVKMNVNGINHPDFNSGNYAILDYGPTMDPVWEAVIDDANRIVLAGLSVVIEGGAMHLRGRMSRLMPKGMLDERFGAGGTVVYEEIAPMTTTGIQNRVNAIVVTQDIAANFEYVVVRILG